MNLKLTNSLNFHNVRRIFLGFILGLIIIGSWVFLSSEKNNEIIADVVYDSEIIPLPNQTKVVPEKEEEEEEAIKDIHSNGYVTDEKLKNTDSEELKRYSYFSSFKASLNEQQELALEKNKPVLSIILQSAGQNKLLNAQITEKLSNNVTLSVSPYLENHNAVVDQFSKYGFEIWMDMAAITLNVNHDYGDLALNPANNYDSNINLLTQQLKNKDKITGLILEPQSLIIQTEDLWSHIVKDIFAEGYGILDNTSQVMKPALFFYNDYRAPYIKGDQVFDKNMTLETFANVLSNVRKSVLEQKRMVITIPIPSPASLDILSEWVKNLEQEGITLVPVSAQAKL